MCRLIKRVRDVWPRLDVRVSRVTLSWPWDGADLQLVGIGGLR